MTRFGWVMATYTATLAISISSLFHPAPKLLWNASASAPIGLYAVRPAVRLQAGELLVVRPPEPLASFLAEGGYLPKGVPLVKHLVALPGQGICRTGNAITVDGAPMGQALESDRRGRLLPVWQGCRTLPQGEVFLMNSAADSLDGRYFGPLPVTAIVGRAEPIWLRREH